MHVLTATTKTSKQTPCSCRDRNESVVSFGYTWPGMGSKAHRPSLRPPDRSRNPYKSPPDRSRNPYKSPPDRIRTPYKSPPTIFFSFTSLMSPFVLTTPGHLPLIFSSQTSTGVRLSVVFNTTQNGSDASLCRIQHHTRWQSLSHRHSTVQQCFLFASISSSLKTAVFAFLSHIEHNTRW